MNTYPATSIPTMRQARMRLKENQGLHFPNFPFASIVKQQQKNCWANAMVYYKELEVW